MDYRALTEIKNEIRIERERNNRLLKYLAAICTKANIPKIEEYLGADLDQLVDKTLDPRPKPEDDQETSSDGKE